MVLKTLLRCLKSAPAVVLKHMLLCSNESPISLKGMLVWISVVNVYNTIGSCDWRIENILLNPHSDFVNNLLK